MIEIVIKTDGKKVFDKFNNIDCTLEETAVVLLRLEQIKYELLGKEFKNDINITQDHDEDEED